MVLTCSERYSADERKNNRNQKSHAKANHHRYKSGDFSEVKQIEGIVCREAANVFHAVASGTVPLIWYDLPPVRCRSGVLSVMRYALHKSTKKPGYLQLSCMELKNGQITPVFDRQYNITDGGFSEFFRGLPQVAYINYLER